MELSNTLRVVVFQEGDHWVAQCLEHDIGAQATDPAELQSVLLMTLQTELSVSMEKKGAPFAGIDPAPQRFQEMWDRRYGDMTSTRHANSIEGNGARTELQMALVA